MLLVVVITANALVNEPFVTNLHRRRTLLESTPVNDGIVVWVWRPHDSVLHGALHHARRLLRPRGRAQKCMVIENVLTLQSPLQFSLVQTRRILQVGHHAARRRARRREQSLRARNVHTQNERSVRKRRKRRRAKHHSSPHPSSPHPRRDRARDATPRRAARARSIGPIDATTSLSARARANERRAHRRRPRSPRARDHRSPTERDITDVRTSTRARARALEITALRSIVASTCVASRLFPSSLGRTMGR